MITAVLRICGRRMECLYGQLILLRSCYKIRRRGLKSRYRTCWVVASSIIDVPLFFARTTTVLLVNTTQSSRLVRPQYLTQTTTSVTDPGDLTWRII